MNPGWRFHLYNASDAPRLVAHAERQGPVPGLARAFACISPSLPQARSDVLRYSALLLHGGVYLDIKARTLMPLDDVFVRPPAVLAQIADVWPRSGGLPGCLGLLRLVQLLTAPMA